VISPLLSNIYLNEVDKMLERAKEVTRQGKYEYLDYARYADDGLSSLTAFRDGIGLLRQPIEGSWRNWESLMCS
jgi:hypothetical protein